MIEKGGCTLDQNLSNQIIPDGDEESSEESIHDRWYTREEEPPPGFVPDWARKDGED